MQTDKLLLTLTRITMVFALVVIVLGAYTRLSNAGLGCPDWPGCYGQLVVPEQERHVEQANQLYPDRPLEQGKAWKEMVHRYAAGGLGLLILVMSIVSLNQRRLTGQLRWTPFFLLGLVVFQALLGMWTVTLLLKPIVVMGHLLGGMTILLILVWQMLGLLPVGQTQSNAPLSGNLGRWAVVGLVVVYMQISLGGWTSANYAALVCPDLPACQGSWWPSMNFREGFIPWRGLGVDYEFGVLDTAARTAVHVSHRMGAVITLIFVSLISLAAIKQSNAAIKRVGKLLLSVLLVQFSLGVANVAFKLPIAIAVFHNGVASLLLSTMGALLFYTRQAGSLSGKPD